MIAEQRSIRIIDEVPYVLLEDNSRAISMLELLAKQDELTNYLWSNVYCENGLDWVPLYVVWEVMNKTQWEMIPAAMPHYNVACLIAKVFYDTAVFMKETANNI